MVSIPPKHPEPQSPEADPQSLAELASELELEASELELESLIFSFSSSSSLGPESINSFASLYSFEGEAFLECLAELLHSSSSRNPTSAQSNYVVASCWYIEAEDRMLLGTGPSQYKYAYIYVLVPYCSLSIPVAPNK